MQVKNTYPLKRKAKALSDLPTFILMPSLERGQRCLLSAMLLCGRQVKGNVTFPYKTRRLFNNKTIWQLSSSMARAECQIGMSRASWTSEYPKEKEVKFSML